TSCYCLDCLFFQAEDGIRDFHVTGVQTCALPISDEEQRRLRTIISTDLAKERHRKRDEARRRAAGAIDRATYEANSLSRRKPWEALGMSRRTWYRVGKPMPPESGTSPCVLQEPDILEGGR